VWFPRLASERAQRLRPVEGPFALVLRVGNAERLHCLTPEAEAMGLRRGMAQADARAICPGLQTRPADPAGDADFLRALGRWATRYCPWAARDGADGLALDITGAAHLLGGEAALARDLVARLARAGLTARTGIAGTRGAAWALARHGGGIAPPGHELAAIGHLPLAALRLDDETCAGLGRMGLRLVDDLTRLPRPALVRRFGAGLLLRLDQALGDRPEPVSPEADPPGFAARLSLPEPIGLTRDVMAGLGQLLDRLCAQLEAQARGARRLRLELHRVDHRTAEAEIGLARPMRDAARMAALFARAVDEIDAGFGIDQMRLSAPWTEPLPLRQVSRLAAGSPGKAELGGDKLADLISRLGNRVGFDHVLRYLPADSRIPERSFTIAPAAYAEPGPRWPACETYGPERPLVIFPPEPIPAWGTGRGSAPPARFRWRQAAFTTARATGPERIAPEWWHDDPAWRSGLRDYWKVETREGPRLWLFHTPQHPGWCVQGQFA